ncbi:hypothetical protein ACFGVR_05875 [Mucilaginibacter sp. AW1-3]
MQKQISLIKLCLIGVLFLSSCTKKYDDPGSNLDRLPPETQTGANTFGCVINGKVFLPFAQYKLLYYREPLTCVYSPGYNKSGYTFSLGAFNDSDNYSEPSVYIQTDSLALTQGQTYILKESNKPNGASAFYSLFSNHTFYDYYTNTQVSGQLYISKLDPVNKIISGTFSFNAVNIRNITDTTHVTLGRFDMKYKEY